MSITISEKTAVPLGLAIVVIGGAAGWLTSLSISNSTTASLVGSVVTRQEKYNDDLREIKERLANIDGQLKRIRPAE